MDFLSRSNVHTFSFSVDLVDFFLELYIFFITCFFFLLLRRNEATLWDFLCDFFIEFGKDITPFFDVTPLRSPRKRETRGVRVRVS